MVLSYSYFCVIFVCDESSGALKVDILIPYECNSSSSLTFVEIRLHAIVILLQYLLMFYFFLSRTALKKSEHHRLTKRIRTELRK